jgi:hypothetical protein
MHQPLTTDIFAIGELEHSRNPVEPCRQSSGERYRHRATVALERNKRETKPEREDLPLNGRLEMIAVCGNSPARIVSGLNKLSRYRMARQPKLRRLIVNGIGGAENRSGRIGGVFVRADKL